MRQLDPYHEGKAWEDWESHCRQHYPVRYFLSDVLPLWVKLWLVWPVKRLYDWVRDHCLPARRYHLLDLRGIDPLSGYDHGYIDPSEVFWLAGWASLMRWYNEAGQRHDQRQWGLDPESPQLKQYCEALELVHYWTVTRIERERRREELHAAADALPRTPENRATYKAARDAWLVHYRESEALEDAMWLRLAAIRTALWD